MLCFALDKGNVYQTNLQEVIKGVYVKVSPLNIKWFKDCYPKYPLPPAKIYYVLQAVQSIQGTKSAGKEWFELRC